MNTAEISGRSNYLEKILAANKEDFSNLARHHPPLFRKRRVQSARGGPSGKEARENWSGFDAAAVALGGYAPFYSSLPLILLLFFLRWAATKVAFAIFPGVVRR